LLGPHPGGKDALCRFAGKAVVSDLAAGKDEEEV
jgi:hypothetical protein